MPRHLLVWLMAGLLASPLAAPVSADVVDATAGSFTVQVSVVINTDAAHVYDALTRDVGRWWDSSHTYSGAAANLSIQATPGGCFCERLPQGGVEHMVVIYADRGKLLRMRGGLGPLQAMPVTGVWTLTLAESGGRTTLVSTYSVSGNTKPALNELAAAVDGVMTEQVTHLKQFAEH